MRTLFLICLLAIAGLVSAASNDELAVSGAALRQYDGGPPVAGGFEFFPGDILYLSFRVDNFQTAEIDDEDSYQLFYTVKVLDPEGIELVEPADGALAGVVTPQDKKQKWRPLVRWDAQTPSSAPSGDYAVIIGVEDRIAKKTVEHKVPFRMRGRNVEPSESLTVRNFNFYRTETSMQAMREPVYRPGDSVWARFDITGYKFGEGNKFAVAYGIKVLRASGKTLFEQPVAAEEERDSFYPERHIQGGLSLNLTKDLTPGEYTVIVNVTDKVGEQTFEEKQVITVR